MAATSTAVDYDRAWSQWGDMIRYSPAPWHRRRLILALARGLRFDSVLDVGCGNGEVLRAFQRHHPGARLCGADVSGKVIDDNAAQLPGMSFHRLDLGAAPLPLRCDLVVSTEVVEHVEDWSRALANLRAMTSDGGHLILTVPAGKLFPIDRMVGHCRHFRAAELVDGLRRAGFAADRVWQWGFPFHTLYKSLINVAPERTMKSFAGDAYGLPQKLMAGVIGGVFFLNLRHSRFGRQLVVRAAAV
jgi:SAM-dependent methyltransferase